MIPSKKTLSREIKNKRLEKGLSIYKVAQLAGMSRHTVTQIEEGERQFTYDAAYKLSKVLFK